MIGVMQLCYQVRLQSGHGGWSINEPPIDGCHTRGNKRSLPGADTPASQDSMYSLSPPEG
eukprot:8212385-Prorocentrum_lima.AAC.1